MRTLTASSTRRSTASASSSSLKSSPLSTSRARRQGEQQGHRRNLLVLLDLGQGLHRLPGHVGQGLQAHFLAFAQAADALAQGLPFHLACHFLRSRHPGLCAQGTCCTITVVAHRVGVLFAPAPDPLHQGGHALARSASRRSTRRSMMPLCIRSNIPALEAVAAALPQEPAVLGGQHLLVPFQGLHAAPAGPGRPMAQVVSTGGSQPARRSCPPLRASILRSSCTVRPLGPVAVGILLTTKMSPASRMPALMAWMSSPRPGHGDDHRGVGHAHDLHLVLAHAHRLHQHHVAGPWPPSP